MIKTIVLLFLLLICAIKYKTIDHFNDLLEISSNSFEKNGIITQKHACLDKGGSDMIPHLYCKHPRNNDVKSYAIIIEDVDAPHDRDTNWTHWLVPYLSATIDFNGNVTNEFSIPSLASFDDVNSSIGDEQRNIIQGLNSWDTIGYRGMCPPKDIIHNFKVSVYVLDIKIEDCQNCSRNSLISKMNGHILYSGATTFKFQSNK